MGAPARKLRVLVVSLGRRGGINRYGWLMAGGLARTCEVASVTSAYAEDRERWEGAPFPHLVVPTFNGLAGMFASLFALPRFLRIRRFARDFAPDVVYYPGGHAYKPLLDLYLPRTAKVVLTVHDPVLHEGENSWMHRAFAAANRLRVDGYVLLNSAQREAFSHAHAIPAEQIAVIPHGIFDDLVAAARPLAELPLLAEIAPWAGRYLLFVGRIQPYKGLATLLAAYRELDPDAALPLVIAGSGELSDVERSALDALDGRDVRFVNAWLSDEELSSLVSAARFTVLPYLSATQSGVIPLASAFGVPAISSDAGGIAEQVADGVTGMLFPAGDANRLAELLRESSAMGDAEYRRLSQACAEHARTQWSWESLAARLVGFFESISAPDAPCT